MRELGNLVFNEMEKVYRKKRFFVIILLLVTLIPLFVYGQVKQAKEVEEKLGTDDWQIVLQQEITDSQNRMAASTNLPEDYKQFRELQIQQQQYYLDHNINPAEPGAPTFVREFLVQGISYLIPLLVIIIAIDLVSGEKSDGTIKMLLTRPIRRWKILASKYIALLLSISVIIALVVSLTYLISGIAFGYRGFDAPVLTGFSIEGETLVTTGIHTIPQWQFILMAAGLSWFVGMIVGTLSFMVSVLVRNTPAGMGIMFAALIAGGLLQEFAASWENIKYVFSLNLNLTSYLTGSVPMLEGQTMAFSVATLSVWGIAALFISFFVFTREDMLA